MKYESNRKPSPKFLTKILKGNTPIKLSIISIILLSILYYITTVIEANTQTKIQSLTTSLHTTTIELNNTMLLNQQKQLQIQSTTTSIDGIQSKLNQLKANSANDNHDQAIQTFIKQIDHSKNRTDLLKKSLNEITNDYTQLKSRLERTIGDQHQLEEGNQLYESKRYQNNILKKSIEELKEKTSMNDPRSELYSVMQSNIIETIDELKTLSAWIHDTNDHSKDIQLRLIYSAQRNGDSVTDFHMKVDQYSPTLTLIYDSEKKKYGGYTEQKWAQNGLVYKEDKFAFLFSLSNKKKYAINSPGSAILAGREFLVAFGLGVDLYVTDKCLSNSGYNYANFPQTYGDDSIKKNEITDYNDYFVVKEMEVFHVMTNN